MILLACGVGVGKGLLKSAVRKSTHGSNSSGHSGTGTPKSTAPSLTPSPSPTETDDPELEKGDCFRNEGTDSAPVVKKTTCGPGTYEVVAKVLLSTNTTDCDNSILGAGKNNYTATFTHDETPGTLGDYVLCLKQR